VKELYSSTGNLIVRVEDTITPNNTITRQIGNTTIEFDQQHEIILKQRLINMKPIKLLTDEKKKSTKAFENTSLGVIDLEVYTSKITDTEYVYACGLFTDNDSKPIIFYLDKVEETNKEGSDKLIIKLIEEMFKPKYNKTTFYCHNFGGYDVFFIIRVLIDYNKLNTGKTYNINFSLRDKSILKIEVSIKDSKQKITICDSYPILTNSLRNLSKAFKVDHTKSVFPHNFANEKTLFYIGESPDISYYRKIIPNITEDEYKEQYFSNK
jgi:hypothetical protein